MAFSVFYKIREKILESVARFLSKYMKPAYEVDFDLPSEFPEGKSIFLKELDVYDLAIVSLNYNNMKARDWRHRNPNVRIRSILSAKDFEKELNKKESLIKEELGFADYMLGNMKIANISDYPPYKYYSIQKRACERALDAVVLLRHFFYNGNFSKMDEENS